MLGLVGLDQASKALVMANFTSQGETIPIIQDFFHFTYRRNPGAAFGIFEGIAESYIIFLVIISIALVIFGIMFVKADFKDKKSFWYILGLTLLISGAIGNGLDRIIQVDHSVVDFIDFRGIWSYIFNVADMCLNVGIAIFIFDQFILEPKRKKVNG